MSLWVVRKIIYSSQTPGFLPVDMEISPIEVFPEKTTDLAKRMNDDYLWGNQ